MSNSPLPRKPSRTGQEVAKIIEQDRIVPAILPAARDALAYARYWHAVAMRYRKEAIEEMVRRNSGSRVNAGKALDAVVLND